MRPNQRTIAATLSILVIAATACGNGNTTPGVASLQAHPSTGGAAATSSPSKRVGRHRAAQHDFVAYADCMNRHGVAVTTTGSGIAIPGSVDTNSAQYQAAQRACQTLIPSTGGSHPAVSESSKQALLEFSQCMRTHGFAQFPDPIFPPGGGVMYGNGPQYDKSSPTFRNAVVTCNRSIPNRPG